MILDSVLTQVQQLRNLPVFHAFGDLRDDFVFSVAQQDLSLRVDHKGWQALNQSLKNVLLLTTVRPHLALADAANALAEVTTRFVAVTYTHRARPKSLNGNIRIVFIQ